MDQLVNRMPDRPAARRDQMRIGDAERMRTIDRLGLHFAAGRLTAEELEDRTAAATGAVTRGELRALELDLPRIHDARRRRRRRRRILLPVAAWQLTWVIPVAATKASELL